MSDPVSVAVLLYRGPPARQLWVPAVGQIGEQAVEIGDGNDRQPVLAADVLYGRNVEGAALNCGLLLAVERDEHGGGFGPCRADQPDRFARGRSRGNHVIDDDHPAADGRAHGAAALAVILGFLAVVGEAHIAAQPRQFHRDHRAERNALVRRAEQHVERHAALQQRARIKLRQPRQHGAVVEQTCVEKIGRLPPRLGGEVAKGNYAAVDGETDEVERVGERTWRGSGCRRREGHDGGAGWGGAARRAADSERHCAAGFLPDASAATVHTCSPTDTPFTPATTPTCSNIWCWCRCSGT